MRLDREIVDGMRLGAVALGSAVLAATLVTGVGRAILPRTEAQARPSEVQHVSASLPQARPMDEYLKPRARISSGR